MSQESRAQQGPAPRPGPVAMLLLCTALAAVGGLGWWLQLRPALAVDASALGSLPDRVADWRAQAIPLSGAVEAVLAADAHVQRAYRHASGDLIWLYVGYYGTDRGGRPEHTPRGCYTGAGWAIESQRVLDVGDDSGLRVNEFVVSQPGQRRLVHFWFRSHRRTGLLGGLDQSFDRLLGRLLSGRADGALIRVSTQLQGDPTAARGRLLAFAGVVDGQIGERWPAERPAAP